jgi:uncharacterized protein (DUF885 family)
VSKVTDSHLSRPVDALCDAFVEEYAALDPIAATEAGLPGHEHELTDFSPDGFAARDALLRRTHTAVRDAQPIDERERTAQDAFLERIGLMIEQHDAHVPQSQVSVIVSGLHDVRATFDLMDTSSEQGWSDISSRLAAVPATLDGLKTTLSSEADNGHVSAARQMVEVAKQIKSWTGQTGTEGNVFDKLIGQCSIDGLGGDLRERAAGATRAFSEFGDFLERDLAPRGAPKEAVGRDRYQLGSRYFLGATVDLEETYLWGFEEMKRLTDAMEETAQRIVPGGSVDDAVAALDADPARSFSTKEAFRDWMQELADRALNELADVHFDIPEQIRRIECCIAPTTDGGVYYTGPSEDFSRPGRMWWSVPEEMTTFSTWREVTTVFHEGVPGHHLQVAQTKLRSELLNRWLRQMCWVSGSGEGWALYSERLMDELGYLDDPGDKMGMLDMQSFRAGRVIVDIGMHLELEIPKDNPFGFHPGERWTPELGYEFMRTHSRMDDAMLRFEINRYLGWPGQAPSYKVGERLWLEAREDAKQRHGSAFHTAALNLGSIGLDPLTAALARI